MAPKASDSHEKALAAASQLQEALLSAAEALKTIAGIVPTLFPDASGSSGAERPTSSSPVVNRLVSSLKDESADGTPPSNKRKRKDKDPDAPEKPISAYHLFVKEKREQVRNAMSPNTSAGEVLNNVNRMWKELSEDLRKVINEFTRLLIISHSSTRPKN
jgi:hypothetical protein